MTRWTKLWIGPLAAAAALGAAAQQQVLTPSETLACLTPAAADQGPPAYPEAQFARKEGGRVSVDLEFSAADRAPKVKVTYGADQRELSRAVLDHVRKYRVPCLKPEQTARLQQDFNFVPTDGRKVRWLAPVDTDDVRRSRLLACVKHKRPDTKPEYPWRALRDETQGTVVLRLAFDAPDAVPAIEVIDSAQSDALTLAASEFARDLRMPCHEGAPISVSHYHVFRIADGPRMVLRDLSLVSLLRSIKGIKQANVYFDFKEMGCPFDLRFKLFQPYNLNQVGEVGEPHPERRFFLDWLQRQQFDLPAPTRNAVIGQITTVSVPCTVLNLGTTSGGGASQ